MEIKRIDPYDVCWSPEGQLAVATNSVGVQLFTPSAEGLLRQEINLQRLRLEISSRVCSMSFSPLCLGSGALSRLLTVLESGDAWVWRSDGQLERRLGRRFSAGCWYGDRVLLAEVYANSEGTRTLCRVYEFLDDVKLDSASLGVEREGKILDMKVWGTQLLVLLNDNSVHLYDFATGQWAAVRAPSEIRCYAVDFDRKSGAPVAACTDTLVVGASVIEASDACSGYLLIVDGEDKEGAAVIHTSGRITAAPSAPEIPSILGSCCGAAAHAELPFAVALVAATSSDWQYPILSWSSIRLQLFPVARSLPPVPDISKYTTPAYWLALQLLETKAADPELPELAVTPCADVVDLESQLSSLFCSHWFNVMRLKWYLAADEEGRAACVSKMRAQIATLLADLEAETLTDRCILLLYSAYTPRGEGTGLVASVKGDFLDDEFAVPQPPSAVLKSQAGTEWKRCAVTLLPLLSVNTRRSQDAQFVSFSALPVVSSGGETSEGGSIASALLSAASFCIYSGTQWEKSV